VLIEVEVFNNNFVEFDKAWRLNKILCGKWKGTMRIMRYRNGWRVNPKKLENADKGYTNIIFWTSFIDGPLWLWINM